MNNKSILDSNFTELILVDKKMECSDIISFYFKGKDGKKLTKHKAGQFLPFKIRTDNEKIKDVIRTYSLSMIPNNEIYRISVKKVPDGLISTYLHENLQIGDSIYAMNPAGIFTINKSSKSNSIVLISAGIGITPLLSMLYEESNTDKTIHFIQAVQNSNIQPFKNDISSISKARNIKNSIFYSNPLPIDKEGIDYNFTGYVNKDWLKENVDLNSDFYFCGPPPFMKGIEGSLIDLGVSKENIHYELFSN